MYMYTYMFNAQLTIMCSFVPINYKLLIKVDDIMQGLSYTHTYS